MKAIGKLKSAPGVEMYDAPKPKAPGPKEVLIKIRKTSICGTDVHIYKWDEWAQKTVPVPLTIGHEFAGVVEEVGSAVTLCKPGDRVSGEGHLTCGLCRNCRAGNRHLCRKTRGVGYDCTGCFSEYFLLPEENVFKLPDSVSDDEAAIFDPFGNTVHTALQFDCVGEDVLITGAGPIGIMAIAIVKKIGARHVVITDINPYRLQLAEEMGATRAVNVLNEDLSSVMQELGMKEGFDVGLEMSGSKEAFNQMLGAMNHGGKVALLGLLPSQTGIDWNQVIFKMLTIQGIYGRQIFETWYKMCTLLESGLNIKPVITHHFHVDDFQKGFDAMLSGEAGKVILSWE